MPDWEVMAFAVVLPIPYESPVAVPSGWEPIGTLARQGNNAVVFCRRPAGSPGGGLVIDSLQPDTLAAGTVPLTVDVYGSGFDESCTVTVDDLAVVTFYVDAGHLQYTARADQATPGQVNVMVVNGVDAVSNTVVFTYT